MIKYPWQSACFQPHHKQESQQQHDYITPPQSQSPHHSKAEPLELNVRNDTQEEKDKDYYFVDTTDIGQLKCAI